MVTLDPHKVLDKGKIIEFVRLIKTLIFPEIFAKSDNLKRNYAKARVIFVKYIQFKSGMVDEFFNRLPEMKEKLLKDMQFFYDSDPACAYVEQVVATYPGYKAVLYYRIAHILFELGLVITARIISEEAHRCTGIDIHPGAKIGCPFFIDHGTGIVVGETTIIGDYCKLYQGVTLGALSLKEGHDLQGVKRHPTIGDNVTIYAGASILGGIEVGSDVIIASNVFIVGESIPSNCKVMMEKPKLILKETKKK